MADRLKRHIQNNCSNKSFPRILSQLGELFLAIVIDVAKPSAKIGLSISNSIMNDFSNKELDEMRARERQFDDESSFHDHFGSATTIDLVFEGRS